MRMSFRNSSLTRRGFLGALASVAPAIASAGRRDGVQPSDALAVSPLDDWGLVETTSGRYLVGELIIRNQSQLPRLLLELRLGERPSASAHGPTGRGGPSVAHGPRVEQPAGAVADAGSRRIGARLSVGADPRRRDHSIGGPGRWDGRDCSGPSDDYCHSDIATRRTGARAAATHRGSLGGALRPPHAPRPSSRRVLSRQPAVVPARFAVDWVRLDEAGRTTDAEADDFGRWFGFGADVLAVADGRVVAVRDSYPDVLTRERPAKWTDDDVAGNYVGLELTSGRFAFYEHLQRGSVRVKVGDCGSRRSTRSRAWDARASTRPGHTCTFMSAATLRPSMRKVGPGRCRSFSCWGTIRACRRR